MATATVTRPAGAAELRIDSGGTITNAGTQASAIADLTITYTTNDPSITANGATTVADGSAATVAELLELVEELLSQNTAMIAALRGVGIIAT